VVEKIIKDSDLPTCFPPGPNRLNEECYCLIATTRNFLVRLMTYCFRKHYKTPIMSYNPTYQNVLNFAIISEIAHTINY